MTDEEYAAAIRALQARNYRSSLADSGATLRDLGYYAPSAAELAEQTRAAAEALPFRDPGPIERTGYRRQVARAFEQGPRPRPVPTMSLGELAQFYGDLGLESTGGLNFRRGVYGIGTGLITGRAAPVLEGLGELALGAVSIAPFVGAPARALLVGAPARALRAKRFRVKKKAHGGRVSPLAVKRKGTK
jgi:hypothetical protein